VTSAQLAVNLVADKEGVGADRGSAISRTTEYRYSRVAEDSRTSADRKEGDTATEQRGDGRVTGVAQRVGHVEVPGRRGEEAHCDRAEREEKLDKGVWQGQRGTSASRFTYSPAAFLPSCP
jgi:hypothetical protein